MGTNKKRKKKKTENKNDMDRKIKFLCHVLLLPLMPIQYSPKKKKRLVSCLKSKSHCGETLSEVAFFSTPSAFSRDGPFMTSDFRVGRSKMTPKDWMLLGKKCWTWWVKNHQKIVVINGRSQLARWRCFIQNVMGITQILKNRNTFSKII